MDRQAQLLPNSHAANAPQAVPDIVLRLRDTPNWRKESFGHWKDCTSSYDRAPFEAADEIERLRGLISELADTELGQMGCAGSHAPVEDVLGRMFNAVPGIAVLRTD